MTDERPRKRVDNVDDLVTWLQWLADDVARAPDAVVHPELDHFLAACATQLRDRARMRRRAGRTGPEQPSWQLIADVLYDAAYHY
ncbi:hypothetical protein Q2K19_11150 [Micromonospora soli]|uniref:DUF7660 family protein n=1 Tax=Micromonospora sp. NBRC 110009 TaxID=3061627 RepID=UPI002670D18E|nr:hypothetical protein [Micromonospora sp. NBRC 110009]WKU02412.1 hypothetical protein Q2K19_11150 [Micromonospora sp. NBRC 110009]